MSALGTAGKITFWGILAVGAVMGTAAFYGAGSELQAKMDAERARIEAQQEEAKAEMWKAVEQGRGIYSRECTQETAIKIDSAFFPIAQSPLGLGNSPCLMHWHVWGTRQHPENVKMLECSGLKVFEDPQPPGHPPSIAECNRMMIARSKEGQEYGHPNFEGKTESEKKEFLISIGTYGMTPEQKEGYLHVWGPKNDAVARASPARKSATPTAQR